MQKFSVYLKEKFAVTQKVGSEETELAAFDSEQEAAAYQKETEDAAKKQKLEIKQMGDDGKEVKESRIKEATDLQHRFTIYYDNVVEMNGRGIKYILDAEMEEKLQPDTGLELILEELSNEFPDFHNESYNMHIFVNGDFSGLSLALDYNADTTPDDLLDKMSDWLRVNTTFKKIENEVKPELKKESTKIDFHKKFKVFKEEDINDFKVGDKVDSEEKQNGEVEAVGTRGTVAGKVKVRWAKDDVEVLCPKKLKLKKANS